MLTITTTSHIHNYTFTCLTHESDHIQSDMLNMYVSQKQNKNDTDNNKHWNEQ